MNDLLFSPNTTVARALQQNQDTASVFIAQKTACVGCYLANFCTLEDVAVTYGLPLHTLLDELQHAPRDKSILTRSSNERTT